MEQTSIRRKAFGLLDQNPYLTARMLAKMLNLSYNRYKNYLWNIRSQWRAHHEIEHGSKCSSHAWRGWVYLPDNIRSDDVLHGKLRGKALSMGWLRSGSRNKFLLWKDYVGRLQWFETGRVNVYVRKPANFGRASQLLANGLYLLLNDVKLFEEMQKNIRFKGAHYVFDTGERLPKIVIDAFDRSNGVTVKIGDRTHPRGAEFIVHFPDWGEKAEKVMAMNIQAFSQLNETLRDMVGYREDLMKKGNRGNPFTT